MYACGIGPQTIAGLGFDDQAEGLHWDNSSMGRGKMIVEFFSAEMLVRVCKYRNCKAADDSDMMSEASFNALEAFCSPSAAMTLARASRAASASAAIAR